MSKINGEKDCFLPQFFVVTRFFSYDTTIKSIVSPMTNNPINLKYPFFILIFSLNINNPITLPKSPIIIKSIKVQFGYLKKNAISVK